MAVPILTYHQISNPPARGTAFRSLTVSPARFARQMRSMYRLGYRGLSMREIMPYVRGARQGKVFGITFDDGYRNVYENAMPILHALGFTATNYFVVRQLGGGNVWDQEKGVAFSPLMSVSEMRAWAQAGHEVGSHTLDHFALAQLSPQAARFQITQSKIELEQLLGAPVTAFCYPYGSDAPAHRLMVHEAGYDNATLTEPGRAGPNDDPFGLPRVRVLRASNRFYFLCKCLTPYEDIVRRYRAASSQGLRA